MIVRPAIDDLLLITQPDHAALAGAVMARWQAGGLPAHPQRASILLATQEHDNGWREPDAAVLADPVSGAPSDFMEAPAAVRQAVWPRCVARLSAIDPYAAALVAMHALTVYDRYRHDDAWQAFFAAMKDLCDQQLQQVPAAARAGWPGDYRFVFIGDLVSLVFCSGWTQPFDTGGFVLSLDGYTLTVDPDPFAGDRVLLRVAARRIPARRYASNDDLRATVAVAPVEDIQGEVRGRGAEGAGRKESARLKTCATDDHPDH